MKRNIRSGVTLIEILIYIALMSITVSGSLLIVFNLIEGSDKLNNAAKIEEEANFIFKKFEWAFLDASDINSPAEGDSAQSVSVNKTNFGSNPIIFDLSSESITMKAGNGPVNILNSESVAASSLLFEHIEPEDERPAGLRSSFTLNGKTYSSLIYLRQ